jgi:hypothetical protein
MTDETSEPKPTEKKRAVTMGDLKPKTDPRPQSPSSLNSGGWGVNGTWTRLKNLCGEHQNRGYFDESQGTQDREVADTALIQQINLDTRLLRRYLDRAVRVPGFQRQLLTPIPQRIDRVRIGRSTPLQPRCRNLANKIKRKGL